MLEPPIEVSNTKSSSSSSSSNSSALDLSPLKIIPLQSIPLETTPSIEPIQPNLIQTKIPVPYETEQVIQDQQIPEPQNLPQPKQELLTQTSHEPQPNLVQSQPEVENQNDFE